ncbi:hypothetical protein MZV50_09165 [Caulobacter sp. RL271]|uniref:Uncharacterized protein n=1 Tax=Caulobacter segnis TaxID=88688 RepID=A0ABY4ZZP8_9CAUL|nr:hypothetical protein [Caulobacter segnis]USQ97679.1 hypothetical protein MZV50_09165 [Caulobacter segnis]
MEISPALNRPSPSVSPADITELATSSTDWVESSADNVSPAKFPPGPPPPRMGGGPLDWPEPCTFCPMDWNSVCDSCPSPSASAVLKTDACCSWRSCIRLVEDIALVTLISLSLC